MEENKNIQSEQQQNQLQTSNALPNMPRLRDKPGIMGFTGFGTTPHQEEDTLTLEYPAFKEQINKALQAGENRDNIRKELAALESVALTQYSYDEVNQFLGRNSDTVPKLIDEMMRQKDNSYIEIMKTDMPEKQVRDILWLAHESGITPGVLLLNPEFAAKIKKDMEGDNPNFLYAGGRNLFSQLQESNVDKYSLAIAEIEQQMENDDILLSEGRRLYEGMLKTKPYLSDDEYRDLARNAFQQQIKNLEEKAKIDAQDAEKWRTQILRPDKYQNWWKYQLYEAIANAGFTGKTMLAGALTYNVGNFIMPGLGAALTPIVDAFMSIDEARSEAAQAYKEYFMRYGDKKKALEVGHNVEAVNRIFLPISNFASSHILEKLDDTLFERWGKKILKGQDFAPTLGRRLTARFVADYLPGLVNALPEGVEEVVQEITSTVAQEDEIDYNRLKEAFTQGVFSGALLGWGRTSIGNVYDYAKEQRYHQNFSREKKFLQKINPKLFGLFKIGNDISNGRLNVDDVVEQTPVVFIPKSKITEEVAQALNIEDETTENNEEIIDPEKATGVSETPAAINVAEIAGEDATAIESEIVPEDEEIAIKKEDWEKFAAENPEQAQALQNYVREGTQGITAQEKIEQATREIIEAVNENPEIKEQTERLEQEFIQAGRPQNEARALAQVAGTIASAINKQYGIPVNQTMNLEAVKGNEQNQANSRQAESHSQRRLFNNAEERLKADSQAWSNLIDRFITNKLSREEQKNLLPVMQTPLVFNLVGVELLPIEIRLENINKIIKRKHLVSPEILKQIPKAITDPIMIFKSEHDTAKGRDSKVILTELKDFDENNVERSIIAAITLKRANRKNGYEINELSTVFKKNKSSKEGLTPEGDIIDWVNRTYKNGEPMHLLEYINKEKSLKWITSTGTTPKASNFIEAISNNIPDETDLVKLRNKKEYEGYYQTSTQNIEENIIPQKQVDTVRRQYEGTDKWLKAPNGKKSNLSETQWLQVRTPNFKKWFGDWENDAENASKVVDENGEPLVVYHGNPNAILNLETTLREKRTVFNVPFSVFRVDKGEGKTERGAFFHEKSAYPMYGFPSEFFLNLRNPATNERKAVFSLTDETVEKLIKDGYDGVIRDIGIGNSEIIAFNPEQIKSATDNRGTFDVNNRDIYYQTQPSGTRQGQAKFYEEFNNTHERPEYLNTGNVTANINDYGNGVEIEFLGERANGISRSAQFPSGRKASQSEREGVIKYLLYDAIPELEMRIHDMFGGFPTVELSEKYQGQDLRNLTAEQKAEILSTAENLIQQMMGDPLSEEGRELLAESRYGEMPKERQEVENNLTLPFNPDDLRTESGRSIEEAEKSEMILTPDGSPNLGVIPEMNNKDFPAGVVQANANAIQRSEKIHGEHIRAAGKYKNAKELLIDVLNNYQQIYKGNGKALFLVIQDDSKHISKSVVELAGAGNGIYRVKDMGLAQTRNFKKKTPLYTRSTSPVIGSSSNLAISSRNLSRLEGRELIARQSSGINNINPNREQVNAHTSWPKNTSSAETQSLVEFFTTANASTGFHEFAHHVLRVLTDAAQLENASDVLINDIKTIFKSAGVKQEDFYNDIGTARQDAQEYFAKSFEAYLHKGQAPTKELQSSFDRIKQWLVDVYQNIKESLGFELNEEMQDIFDRLLATPEQLAEQKSISDIETLYAATEGEIQLLQKEINDLEAQLLANSQAWEKTTEKAYVKGEKQGRKTQKEIDKVKFADKITKLKQRQKEMKERQRERQNIKKKVAKLVKNINRMAKAQNVDWFRQQDIKNLLDTYDTAKLRSLNLQDIEYLHNQVKEIYETGKRELAQKRLAKQKYIEQARRELAEPLRKDWENRPKGVATSPEEMGKQYKGVKGRIQKILDWTTAKTLGAQIFFDYLDGYKHNKGAFSKYFLDDVNEAYNTKLVHIYARLGAMEKAMARLGIKPKDLAKTREFSAPHRNGKNWTVEELIGIYAGLKNSKSRDAILFGNFSIAESYEQAEAWATEAVSKLSENEKALGDFIIQEYEENFERINNALVKVWNKGMKHEENYTPIRRLEVTSSNGGMINPDAAAEALINPNSNGSLGRVERGFSQSRVNFRQKTQPGMNLKIVSVWYSQVEAQEHAAAFGGVVQNLRRILLGKGKDSEASIYKMIRETRGKYAAEMIKQYFNIAATNETMQAYNLLDDIAKFLAKNMSIAYLCGNMGTALKQFNSFFFAVPYTSPTAMINNFIKATTNWKKFSEECFRLDPQLKARNGDPFIQELRKVKSIVYDNLLKWGSTPIGFMDRFTSCVVFKSVYDSNLRQGLSQNDAIKEAQRVVLLTQPPAHAKDKSLIWQQHGYARLAMMFTNSLSNIYGITMYELTQAIRNGEVPRAFTTAIGLTLAAMYITALTSGGPDEPDDPEEWAKWTASAFTEQTINSIPLIGKEALALWDYRRGYFKNDSAFIAPFAKLAAGTRGLWDDKSDNDERAIWNLIEGGSLLAPFPSTALHRLYNVGKELGEGEIGAALKRMVGINKEEKRIKKAVSY